MVYLNSFRIMQRIDPEKKGPILSRKQDTNPKKGFKGRVAGGSLDHRVGKLT